MTKGSRWTKILKEVLPIRTCCDRRPFICNGFPEDCDIFIIGNNPAKRVQANWWDYWNEETGFDMEGYNRVYGDPSRTSKYIERFGENGLTYLKTNVFSSEGSDKISNKEVIKVLLCNTPNLKGIFAHGVPAKNFFDELKLVKNYPELINPQTCEVHLTSHLCERGRTKEGSWAEIDKFCCGKARRV